jgi:hypothetical protein
LNKSMWWHTKWYLNPLSEPIVVWQEQKWRYDKAT